MLACLALPAQPALSQIGEPRTLSLTAQGHVDAAPDMARLQMRVQGEAASAGAALEMAAERVRAVFAALDAAGIAASDRQTRDISLDQVHDRDADGNRVFRAYRATQWFTVILRDLEGLGSVLDALTDAGLDAFSGLAFDVSRRETLVDEARRLAMTEARRIAALMAEAAGETLGAPLSITLQNGGAPRPMEMRAAAADAVMPVAPGEITVSATVSVTYALE
jgi:uncharacterized protein YggE